MKHIEAFLVDNMHLSALWSYRLSIVIALIILLLACGLVHFVGRKILLGIIHSLVKKTKSNWDDMLFKHKVFSWIAHVFPALLLGAVAPIIFKEEPHLQDEIKLIINAYLMVITGGVLFALLNAVRDIITSYERFRDKPISSYIQLAKIFVFLIIAILTISILAGKSPLYFLSAMGALSAVLLLIFKDTILGFVASIQIAANDMVRVGDWVTVEKYGADGDVEEINLATIKVRNFDKTITTVPTYSLISDSFRNWRGMEESAGRRIKRAVNINKNSIAFLKPDQIEELKRISILKPYIEQRLKEIEAFNKTQKNDINFPVNGRRLTNIGVFRKYVEAYVKNNNNIHKEMTCMVRQLAPTPNGLPIEIYAFSTDKAWANYELIMADIFDHVLSVVPYFGLSLFQNPTGHDFQKLSQAK